MEKKTPEKSEVKTGRGRKKKVDIQPEKITKEDLVESKKVENLPPSKKSDQKEIITPQTSVKKWKLFGLINPVDLVVIMILFALVIKVFWTFRPAPLMLKPHQVTVGLLIKNVPPYLADSITVGQDLYLDRTNTYLGKIQEKKTGPAQILLEDGGKLLLVKSPQNLDLRLELKRNGEILNSSSHRGIYLGKLAVRVGDRLKAHTLYSSIRGEIEYLKVKQ